MAETDARQILQSTLDRYGLGSLRDQVWQLYTDQTITANTPIDAIGDALVNTPEFQARFPANAIRRAKGLPEYSVSEYIGMERGYKNAMQGSGLPSGFYDDSTDFSNLIAGDVSVAEVQDRINQGFRAVSEANPEVIKQMKDLYGVGEGDLAAYFLDPEKATPLLTRQARAAQIAAEAQRQAQTTIGASQAELLAREGVTAQQAQTGFKQIAIEQQLYQGLPGETGALTLEEQMGAVFGTNEAARQRIETRRRQRQAQFEAGGGFAESQTGVVGLTTL